MRELAVFSRQFATLVASGMPMLRTLHTLEEQTQDEMIREAVAGVRADVEAGSSLEQAMERHPKVFDRLFRAMVRSGEQSGRLEDALDRIAFQVEKTDALRRQVKSALMYPALVFGVATVVLLAVVAFIIPVFVGIFEEIAADNPGESAALPLPTQICVTASDAITGYWYLLLPGLVLSFFAFFRWKKTDKGHELWDKFKLRLPFKIGDVIQKVALARWSRTFAGSVAAGVPMLQSIKSDRRHGRQHRRRAGDGRRLRLGQARRLAGRPDRGATRSSRRWSATWSPSARRPASSSTCSPKSPTSTRPRSTPRSKPSPP